MSRDKMHLTQTEWKYLYGGKVDMKERRKVRLDFDVCALSLRPWADPVTTQEGKFVFDLLSLVPYVKKNKKHPITGKQLELKDLKKLTYHKNREGKYHCPVTMKTFTNNTKIAANIKSGHVYSYEAVKELNIRAKNWTDLVTGEKFSKSDIVILQDPSDITEVPIPDLSSLKEKKSIKPSEATKRVLEEMKRKKLLSEKDKTKPRSRFTSGKCAASFTSTAVDIHTTNERAIASKAEIEKLRYERVRKLKKKGYVRLVTNRGNLNLELHCDMVPRTCENFIRLASSGYYDGILFHRLIRNFMIQGGDPTGTGRGGESIWKKPFKDEFNRKLSHEGRGVLSMANSGPNTNGSQFFITFKTCRHLDKKHSVFGSVVGGMDVLNSMERVETDSNDRPKEDLKIMRCDVFVNPYDEVAETDGKKAVTRTSTKKKKRKKSNNQWGVRSFDDDYDQGEEVLMKKRKVENGSSKIGKYLNL